MNEWRQIAWQGLWKSNPGLVQLLGLCPLLATSTTLINGLSMGLATMFVLACSNLVVALIRNHLTDEIRIPVFVLMIAGLVTCVQLLMQAFTPGLYQNLGIFVALIVTNCIIIGRAEAYASKNPVLHSTFDGAMMGLGFTLVLVVLGALRELLGQGTLFAGADLLLGAWASSLTVHVGGDGEHFLLAMLAPGAFIGLAMLVAAKNAIDARLAQRQRSHVPASKPVRARVTGAVSGNDREPA